jgi:hypothetical protein
MAEARPIPEAAPVTMIDFPVKRFMVRGPVQMCPE